ncbi:ArgP/LysG family DNA-binding transcriptional regulator [Micrococcus terreus]|uniref:ArgP/LysG family DNA-binding transcriptional regulator n=1 Tax=Micrococcus terreus TaxID=574650 RepID=UPI0023F8FA64|nr:ArgP/LysG family DNA-binding transcriptional regulator [Micrococcus terreus]
MNTDHLRALAAAVDEGTFEAAAAALRISGSAFSQRIKALEKDLGQVLLTRTIPVTTTVAGDRALRLARQVAVLEDEARRSMGQGGGGRTVLRVAVNVDSLATWFVEVLRQAVTWDDVVLQLQTEDQGHTHELLRSGAVVAAVGEEPQPVTGCISMELGQMGYHAVAASALLEHYAENGVVDFGAMPVVDFGPRDTMQRSVLDRLARERGLVLDPPRHVVPSSETYLRAVELGMGWGMFPDWQLPAGVLEGTHPEMEMIPELGSARIGLHWQRWSAGTGALDRLTAAVQQAARHMV